MTARVDYLIPTCPEHALASIRTEQGERIEGAFTRIPLGSDLRSYPRAFMVNGDTGEADEVPTGHQGSEPSPEVFRDFHKAARRVLGQEPGRSGPAQVATEDYRDGWDRIFGRSSPRGQA